MSKLFEVSSSFIKSFAILAQCGLVVFCALFYFDDGPIIDAFRRDAAIVRMCPTPISDSSQDCKDAAFRVALLAPVTVELADARRQMHGNLMLLAIFALVAFGVCGRPKK